MEAGLVPAIHVLQFRHTEDVDARHKAGHDDEMAGKSAYDQSAALKRVPRSRGMISAVSTTSVAQSIGISLLE